MHSVCFTDPLLQKSFLEEPEAAAVDNCVQEALNLERTMKHQQHIRKQHPHSITRGESPGWVAEKDYLNKAVERWKGSDSDQPRVKEEIKVCLSLLSIPAEDDPLVWGGTMYHSCLTLPGLPGSFCASQQPVCHQRVLSAREHIISHRRPLLKPDKVNVLACLYFSVSFTYKVEASAATYLFMKEIMNI